MKKLSRILTILVFIFLFAPIAVLVFFSFNSSKSLSVFDSFSWKWYQELFRDKYTLASLKNTLVLALSASAISTVMGTAAAVGINKLRSKFMKNTVDTVTNIPMTNPDIITGISLMLLFVFTGSLLGLRSYLSFWTMLIAHVTFCLPYVILEVLPKLQQMDRSLPEAAMDLGCTPIRAFFRVELPEISSGIITGAIMAFTLSLDDFVISYFTQGNGYQTLPIRIYSMTKKTVTPKMYALSSIIFFFILALLIFSSFISNNDQKAVSKKINERTMTDDSKKKRHVNLSKKAKTGILSGIAAVFVGLIAFFIIKGSDKAIVLNVYNWGEYISDGSEGTLDTIAAFEDWYFETYNQRVKVNYDTFTSNEDMYNKLTSGAVSYDVIIPSDYMVSRLREEGRLLPLNYTNIPNYQYISDSFHGLYYDPDDAYSIPYAYGIVGIIYDANVVDEADTGDWDLMWNPKYAKKILQFNNPRDAFGTAQYYLGLDVNSTDQAEWQQALSALKKQLPLVLSQVMDEMYNMMEMGEGSISAYYAGDYFTMRDAQADTVDLQFYYPERTNYYIDAFCIPSCSQNKDLAEIFINFMLSEEAAVANAEYTFYASPNSLVYTNEDYIDYMDDAYDVIYPDFSDFAEKMNQFAYRNLSPDMLAYINKLWEEVKIK